MDKDTIRSIMDSLSEEMDMMKGTNIGSSTLQYLDGIIHTYKKLKCLYEDLDKFDNVVLDKKEVDEKLQDSLDEYKAYVHYKEEYKKSNEQVDLDMAEEELDHFLQAIVDAFSEIEELSRDNMDERTLIKSKAKQIYQSFS